MITAIDKINNKVVKILIGILLFVFGALMTEGGMTMIPFMLITYLNYDNNKARNIWYVVLSVVLFSLSFNNYGDLKTTINMLAFNSDFMFIFVLPFIYMYNGEKGTNSKFGKYLFYIFYPAHLWIITTVYYIMSK